MVDRMAKAGIFLSQIKVDTTEKDVGLIGAAHSNETQTHIRTVVDETDIQLERTPDGAEDHASEIVKDFLYLGSDDVASNLIELQGHKITHILNMSRECRNHFEPIPMDRPFLYLKANLADNPFEDFYNFIPKGIHFIESAFDELLLNNKAAVLVHCWAGRSRSPCMVIAYLMYKHGYRLDAAAALVRTKRPETNTSTFLDQLRDFEFYLARSGHFELADQCRARDQPFLPRPIPVEISPPASQRPLGASEHQSKSLQHLSLFTAPTPDEQRVIESQRIQEQLLSQAHNTRTDTPGSNITPGLTVITRMPPEQRHAQTKGKPTPSETGQMQQYTTPSDAHIAKMVHTVGGAGTGSEDTAKPPSQPARKEADAVCCIVM